MANLVIQDWESGARTAAKFIGAVASLITAIAKLLEAWANAIRARKLAAGSRPGPVVVIVIRVAQHANELIPVALGVLLAAYLPSVKAMVVVFVVFLIVVFRSAQP